MLGPRVWALLPKSVGVIGIFMGDEWGREKDMWEGGTTSRGQDSLQQR